MVKKDELIAELDERYQPKKEGGKTMGNEEFLPKKDYEHQRELERLTADAEKKEAEHQQALETINRQLKEALDPNHRSHCVGPDCQINQVHSQIFQEGFDKGKTDALANLKVDDIPAPLIGEWIREMRKREGK